MIPANLGGVFWSKDIKKLNVAKNKIYIIHQVLAFGEIADIHWLFKTFGEEQIAETFTNYPQKVYTKASFNFEKKILLGLNFTFDEKKYIKSTF